MSQGQYLFHHGVNGLFEMDTADAERLLPRHLSPIEIQHGRSVLSITCFTFHSGDAGPYEEVVLSVLVPPRIQPGQPHPDAAMFPLMVACSTEEGRRQGIERWHLPHYMSDIVGSFEASEDAIRVGMASTDGAPILEMTVTAAGFAPRELLYQSFMESPRGRLGARVVMKGPLYSEHEEGRGSLALFDHPLTAGLAKAEIETLPFREQWMKDGAEIFFTPELLS